MFWNRLKIWELYSEKTSFQLLNCQKTNLFSMGSNKGPQRALWMATRTVCSTSTSRHTILNLEWIVMHSITDSSNFGFNVSSPWRQKHSSAVVIAMQFPPQMHHLVFPTLAFKLNDSFSLLLASSVLTGSSPGE